MLAAGFTDYLAKPVNINEMEQMMIRYLPKDEVILTKKESKEEDEELESLPDELFSIDGLDPKVGLDYCGDADDYLYAIEVFAASVGERKEKIEKALDLRDIDTYTTDVHSLKSMLLSIGASELSEKAKSLEMAARGGDWDRLAKETPKFLEAYVKLGECLSETPH